MENDTVAPAAADSAEMLPRTAAGSPTPGRPFTIFWIGQTLSSLGDAVAIIAFPLLILQTTGSLVQMGLVTAAAGVGQLAAGFFSGVLADRVDRRRLMIGCQLLSGLLLALIPLVWSISGPQPWLIYVLMPPFGALAACFGVVYVTAIPNLVDLDQVTAANARLQAGTGVTFVIGPVVGGFLVTHAAPSLAIGADALTFGISALFLYVIRLRAAGSATDQRMTSGNVRRDLLEGLRFLVRQPLLRATSAMLLVYELLNGGAFDLFIYHLRHDLRIDSAGVGLIFSIASAGAVLAAIVTPYLRRRWGFSPGFLGGFGVAGLAMIGLGLSTSGPLIALCALLYIFGQTVWGTNSMSLRQEITPDHLLGRVTALVWTSSFALAPLGAALTTMIASRIGDARAIVIGGLLVLLVAAAGISTAIGRRHGDQTLLSSYTD